MNSLASKFSALNQFVKFLYQECESLDTTEFFNILNRPNKGDGKSDWTEFLGLEADAKVKILSIKILSNAVIGAKSTGDLFYTFLQLFEKIIDSEEEYAEESM